MKYQTITGDRYYHIYNRGNNGTNLFFEERNYEYFLRLIEKHVLPVADIYAFCLLKNHFHFLIKTKDLEDSKRISKGFSNLFNAYSKAINKAYNRSGSLFQDRFKRKMIEDEEYFKTLILYIHLNPLSHNFSNDFMLYKYSSYSKIISKSQSFLKVEEILELFGNVDNFRFVHHQRQNEILEMEDIDFI